MAIITTGNNFGATDAVTNTKLNNIANAATFDDPADETSIEKITSGAGLIGKLGIKDGGVTKTKIENVANLRVLGNTSGSPTAPQEVEIIDSDTMTGATATNLATSESIKAYADSISVVNKSTDTGLVTEGAQGSVSLGGGLIVKFGSINHTSSTVAFTFKDSSGSLSPFPNAIYGVNATVNESVSSASETCSVTLPTVNGCSISGYRGVSGAAVGRVFFVAYGY